MKSDVMNENLNVDTSDNDSSNDESGDDGKLDDINVDNIEADNINYNDDVDEVDDVDVEDSKRDKSIDKEFRVNGFSNAVNVSKKSALEMVINPLFLQKCVIHRKRHFHEAFVEEDVMLSVEESWKVNYFLYIVDQAIAFLTTRYEQYLEYEDILEWGVTNGCRLDTLKACQDLVDHIAPPGYFLEIRHLHNDDFLRKYNINLTWQVAMDSQLRLRFEQEAKLLKKSIALVARRDQRIQARENEIKNLEALLEAETDMKNAAEAKNAELVKELENLRALFTDLQSIDFDEELYPHMLTAIAGRRWVIGHGLRLAVMKCGESTELRQVFADVVFAGIAKGMNEGLKYRVEHGKANLDLEALRHMTRSLKDASIDVIMTSLHLESDSGEDAPQWIREIFFSSSQLKIHVYSKVRDPKDPWSFKEEILLVDAIAANVSHAEKKKKCQVVCRTHGVGYAHHARSDGVPMSVPTIAPHGLAILLADAST
uniref:Transposase (Putative), gypsy type n=1 Tax=Tanacetum cinerariifolium TaxID=118510 RepID=A0A6L2N7H3_TANCI|nr:hypothetical protein [Tanacetum cinerariifolium]